MLVFCRYTVVYNSAIPQVTKGNCNDCICIYTDVFWCIYVSAWLYQIFPHFFCNSDPVSVCVVLYVIILIQIRIRYNVKHFITACTRLHDSDPQNWEISLPWEGGHPPPTPSPPLGRFAPSSLVAPLPRICSQYIFCQKSEIIPPPPHF